MSEINNDLQKLIKELQALAHFIHCHCHRLNLAIVSMASSVPAVASIFNYVQMVYTITQASTKRPAHFKEVFNADILAKLESGELSSGKGLNQQQSIQSGSETRWDRRISNLLSIMNQFGPVLNTLRFAAATGKPEKKSKLLGHCIKSKLSS